jgi:SAM-dependent methyltransferase
MSDTDSNLVEAGYDAVYAAMPTSPTLRRLWREHAAGLEFPEELPHISFVTVSQLQRMARELHLSPERTLVDLGCGMSGPALWVARQTGAKLVGVDLSAVAVAQATARAAELGLTDRTNFVVGTFADTGLPDSFADGIMSEDALQYAPDKRSSFAEAARISRRGGRFVFTAFELDPAGAAGLPVIGDDPVNDYRPLLEAAGFRVDVYEEVPGWSESVTGAYGAVIAARDALVGEMGEAAFAALAFEMSLTLERKPYKRRVLAIATKK